MFKLIKEINEQQHYWEVWNDGKTITEHWGVVGDTGESKEMKVSLFQRTDKVMRNLADEKVKEGYIFLDEDQLPEIIIQHTNKDLSMEEAFEKRNFVEELMNECLGWTGNGFVDGGEMEVESFLTNVFCPVVNVEAAFTTILKELKENNLMEGVTIAYCLPELPEEEQDEDYDNPYITLYPEGGKIEF
jgi:predicted DNA-binding WGR domain protein